MTEHQPEVPAVPGGHDVWGADFGQVGWRQQEAPAVPGVTAWRHLPIREYRVLPGDEDPEVVLIGQCAGTVGCLFQRTYGGENGVALGVLIDAAMEHEGVQGEQAHARIAGIAAEWDAYAEARNAEVDGEPSRAESPAPAPAGAGAMSTGPLEPSPVAGRVEQDTATARTLITPALLAELGRRLYEYENAIDWNTSCTSCAAVMDSSIREHERAERAESKLSVLQASARAWAALAPDDDWGESMSDTIRADCGRAILAIIGTEGMAAAEGCPVAFIPGDPEFCTKCTCDQPARHGGSHHCPHCGVWYTLASDVKRAAATEGDGDHA